MNDSLTLYRTLIEFVWQNGVRFHDLRCLITFVWALVGLLLSQQIHVSQWVQYRPGSAKAASNQRQVSRWLHNQKIEPVGVYGPLIKRPYKPGRVNGSIWSWTAAAYGGASP